METAAVWPGIEDRQARNLPDARLSDGRHDPITTVLGIDAAWTAGQASGVALVSSTASGWRCVAVSPSYSAFMGLAAGLPVNWGASFAGQPPDVLRLLSAAQTLAGAPVDLVTVDMPVSTVPITGRREADNAVSRIFGARGCSTHTPNSLRPGPLGAMLSEDFAARGFPIAAVATPGGTPNHLLEVYPHPALLSLLRRDYRVPYKASKAQSYWPALLPAQRIASVISELKAIHYALFEVFGPPDIPLPQASDVRTLSEIKKYEDSLDALVCAWVGVQYLEGAAVSLGDKTAAIWCPSDVTSSRPG